MPLCYHYASHFDDISLAYLINVCAQAQFSVQYHVQRVMLSDVCCVT